MKLKVLASGSSGNCYLLYNKDEILIIEAGISFSRIQKALNYDFSKVVGCLVSHEHMDHAKSINKLLDNAVDVYSSKGTLEALELENKHRQHILEKKKLYQIGNFEVVAFDTQHDCQEPLGFMVRHKDMGTMLFITDSYYIKYKFREVDHILVEANYSEHILKRNEVQGIVNSYVAKRIRKSHFEISDVVEFLQASDLSDTKNIVLLHLSSDNSKEDFKDIVESKVGIPTFIAREGLEIPLLKGE